MNRTKSARAVIRHATARDWSDIAELLTASGLPLDGAAEHVDEFVVAEQDGALVGCAAVERYGGAGLLRSVAVADAVRGHGLGVELVEHCLANARAASLSDVVLLTTTAERFFPRFGFEIVDRSSVPAAVQQSVEFRSACPASATVMRLRLGGD